jgi:hypothetical protein
MPKLDPSRVFARARGRSLTVEGIARALLAVAAFAAYWAAGPGQENNDPFNPLAAALLQGRLSIPELMPWLESIPAPDGGWYVPLAPGPAVLLMPLVALVGPHTVDTNLLSALFGALAVWLAWGLVRQIGGTVRHATWLTVGLAAGSELTWVSTSGGPHNIEHNIAMALLFASLRLAIAGRAPAAAGLLWAVAVACRVPVGLAFPLFAWLYRRRLAWFALAAAPIAAAFAAYNMARFGSPIDFGLARIMGGDPPTSVLDEPWYDHGIIALEYLPRGLHTMFLRTFDIVSDPPWFRPNWTGASVLLTMPVLAWLHRARARELIVPWLTVVVVLVPDLLHGAPGFAQFGYRFICDVLPILWWLLAWVAVNRGLTLGMRAAIVAGIAVNAYAIWTVWGLDFVGY